MEEGNSEQGELHQEGNSSPSKRKQYLRLAGGHGDGTPGRIQGIAGKKIDHWVLSFPWRCECKETP